jgi:hypothetical protein
MAGCNHVREYEKQERQFTIKQDVIRRTGIAGCNHVRAYTELSQAKYPVYELCKHGVEMYCRQCLEETGYKEDVLPSILEVIQPAVVNLPSKPIKPAVTQAKKEVDIYRLKGNTGTFKRNLYLEKEAIKFKTWRRSAINSLRKHCINYGIKFDFHLAEDAFQDALIFHMQYKDNGLKWIKEKGLPINALLNKYTRRLYFKHSTWLNSDSLDTIIEEVLNGNIEVTEAFYRATGKQEKHLDNITFYETINEVLEDKQVKIIKLILKGYTNKKETCPKYNAIGKELKLHHSTIKYHTEKIKTFLASGVTHF